MSDAYNGNILPGRAIYRSSDLSLYFGLLIVSKFLRSVGLFIAYDLLKLVPVVQFLFFVKLGTAVPLLFLQKPFGSGRRLNAAQWFRVGRHALFGSILGLLWLFGLTLCGPLRTVLLYEHSDVVVIAGATALFISNSGGPAKLRGAVFFIIAVIALLLFDHDEKLDLMSDHEANEDIHRTVISHVFYHLVNLVGWSDHKGGVVLMFITLCLQVGFNTASKKLSVEIGGAKRLHSLSTLVSSALLLPWAGFIYLTRETDIQSTTYLIFPFVLVILFVFILDYYIDAVSINHLNQSKTALYGSIIMFISAVFLSTTWNHPYVAHITTMHKLKEIITEDHVLSGGVVFSVIVFMFATRLLVSQSKSTRGSFIGYSPAGVPLYTFAGDALHRTSQSVLIVMKNGLRQILEESDSRRIFYFLCINLGFTFVELTYGVWTNSLGLISDGFHMLFDCSALVMGLYASIMVRWKPTRIFSFGYDRVEVLSGFINGLFLVVIAIFVFSEAVGRLFEPPEISTERLLIVSVIGLLVNLIGIFAFSGSHGHSHGGHGHSHGAKPARDQCSSHGGHGHSHGGQNHGHSHGGHSHGGHGHSHGGHGHSHGGHIEEPVHHNTNMEGVFLHVLADTLGSVGVIISTLLIENFGWNIADPLCSLFIATMILLSVAPLLKATSVILLLRTPNHLETDLSLALEKIIHIEGVIGYRDPHFWSHTSTKVMGMLHIQVTPDTPEQKIVTQVTSILKELGIQNIMVQIEKELYYYHLSGLNSSFDQMLDYTQNFQKLQYVEPSNRIKAI
ncbi:proton-coupled zinc antiporter SLC30A5 [Patella vulgata]|uniref:proton-coupled zinc antiporter SLC30A5 n=1 Tax=Patella vulgata TaxID=6465 RepID=UPI00218050AA|nr:proton-coupled zinc antiporter SLC30A5 [Patella vulgata]